MKVLIIEDDFVIADHLKMELQKWQYDVHITQDFSRIMTVFNDVDPHLILLDINLPVNNGYYWCQEIRRVSNVPIVFISSRTDNMDQIMAMQLGGDDFVQKPFDIPVTIAKIQALLRRTYNFSTQTNLMSFGGAELHTDEARLHYHHNDVELTRTELQILLELFEKNGAFASREAIMERCWQGDEYIDDNTLAVNMTRLRKKLKSVGLNNFIETKKNVGYRLINE
jgi:two-component system response regulator protein BraR/BceR